MKVIGFILTTVTINNRKHTVLQYTWNFAIFNVESLAVFSVNFRAGHKTNPENCYDLCRLSLLVDVLGF